MKKPEYPSSNRSHSSHPKLHLPFQWSTRRRLVTTIVIVFFMLTGVVTAMTYYVVNRQLETVTVNKSFTQAEDADEQHSLNSIPPESDKDYVSAGYDSGKDALTLTMEQGDIKSRDLIFLFQIRKRHHVSIAGKVCVDGTFGLRYQSCHGRSQKNSVIGAHGFRKAF